MAKLKVRVSEPPRVRTSPAELDKLWHEVWEESRREADTLRERQRRVQRAHGQV